MHPHTTGSYGRLRSVRALIVRNVRARSTTAIAARVIVAPHIHQAATDMLADARPNEAFCPYILTCSLLPHTASTSDLFCGVLPYSPIPLSTLPGTNRLASRQTFPGEPVLRQAAHLWYPDEVSRGIEQCR